MLNSLSLENAYWVSYDLYHYSVAIAKLWQHTARILFNIEKLKKHRIRIRDKWWLVVSQPAGVARVVGVLYVVRDGQASGLTRCVSNWVAQLHSAQRWSECRSLCHGPGCNCCRRLCQVATHLCSLFSSLTAPVTLWCTSLVNSIVSSMINLDVFSVITFLLLHLIVGCMLLFSYLSYDKYKLITLLQNVFCLFISALCVSVVCFSHSVWVLEPWGWCCGGTPAISQHSSPCHRGTVAFTGTPAEDTSQQEWHSCPRPVLLCFYCSTQLDLSSVQLSLFKVSVNADFGCVKIVLLLRLLSALFHHLPQE